LKRLPGNNRALMAQVDRYLQDKSECSMGEIEEELGIPIWKQYWLYRAYSDFFPATQLVNSRWKWNIRALENPVPKSSQDILSSKGD